MKNQRLPLSIAASLVLPVSLFAQNTFPSTGNVGIGASAPGAPLQVGSPTTRGIIRIEGTLSAAPALAFADRQLGAHSYNIYSGAVPGSFSVVDTTVGASRFLISSNGNVGIGNIAYNSKASLEVASSLSTDFLRLTRADLTNEYLNILGVPISGQGTRFVFQTHPWTGSNYTTRNCLQLDPNGGVMVGGMLKVDGAAQIAASLGIGGSIAVADLTRTKDLIVDGAATFNGSVNVPLANGVTAGSFYSPGFVAYRNAGGAIELGVSGQQGSTPFIDFHHQSDAAGADNNMRIINSAPHVLKVEGGDLSVVGKVLCTTLELTSDRHQKSDFQPISPADILDKVASLPLTSWAYTNSPSVRHVGPMAQDFWSAFQIGSDDRHIGAGDELGVALAAIQGLHAQSREKDTEIERLRQEILSLKRDQASVQEILNSRLSALERGLLHTDASNENSASEASR